MELILKNHSIFKSVRIAITILFAMAMAACGGGGGSAGTTTGTGTGTGGTTTTTGNGTIRIVLTDASGVSKNTITAGNPLVAKATVTNDTGTPLQNRVVTFTVSSTIATISPSAGTALTDANGIAQISIQSAGLGSGAAEVTASVTVGSAAVTAKAAFSVGASPTATPTAINFVSAVPSDSSIVIKGSGGNGRTEVALLTFRVVDSSNNGIANQQITFTTQSSQPVSLVSATGTTGSDGQVTVALNSGANPTTVRVVATVTGTVISTLSDTITVTTGQPTQAAFSLSLAKYYVEGLDHDNVLNTVTVLLADSFGGAVADGTQIVFTTDSGAIVGTGGAKCLTAQGACTVTWRSQNPRLTSGLGTIIATATSGTANLAATANFYYSGSFGIVYAISPSSVAGATTRLTAGGAMALNFTTDCTAQAVNIEVVDANGNPMPEGTVLSGVNVQNAAATFSPAIVAFTGMRIASATRGTVHSMTVTPSSCDITGAKTKTGFLDISVKSPLGNETFTRVSLGTFPSQ